MKVIYVSFDEDVITELIISDLETSLPIPESILEIGERLAICAGLSEQIEDEDEFEEALVDEYGFDAVDDDDLLKVICDYYGLDINEYIIEVLF